MRRPFRLLFLLCLAAVTGLSTYQVKTTAQHAHGAATANAAVLIPGLGGHHHVVSTSNSEAQQFFDQGVSLIYGFNHEAAAKSFKRASELDPNLAMAHWGYAYAVGPNYNEPTIDLERMKAAFEAVGKAQKLLAGATERERAYVGALAKRFTLDAQPDAKRLGRDYMEAMRDVYRRFPDDLDAATLYADSLMNLNPWQLWTKDGKPAEGTEEIVSVLESVLARDPDHLGANHLYIHAVEASQTPHRALPSANRLERRAPAAGHLVHMPGHIYLRTGNYEASARTNEAAAEADRTYLKRTGESGMYAAMYYSHNLHFLVESYGRMGMYRDALRSAGALSDNVRGHVKTMPMVEGFFPSSMFIRLKFAKWEDVLKFPEPERDFKLTHAIWRFARGVAFAATKRASEAESERTAFLEAAKNLPGETPFGLNSAESVLKIASNQLDARIKWARVDRASSIESWRRAVVAQDALNYDEPPGWYYAVRESLGAALLLSGDAAQAEHVFRDDLRENPRNGRSLFGLRESLKAQGKTDAAVLVDREFATAWKSADTQLRIEDL
jgi:tetratricopeptide (TPR) repeat protein